MQDLAIALDNRPGARAEMGDTLGRAGASIEGGGAFVVDDIAKGRAVSEAWARERRGSPGE